MIQQLNCTYISPNKTLEEILISRSEGEKTIYVYNYKGLSYRVFKSQEELNKFWKGESDEHKHFQTEQELDDWLHTVDIL